MTAEPATGTPGQSCVSLEASEVSGNDWTEAMASIDREGETDPELCAQILLMTPAEMKALYERLNLYYEQGIWSTGTVEP